MSPEEEIIKKYRHNLAKKAGLTFAKNYKANPQAYPHVQKLKENGPEILRRYRESKQAESLDKVD